MSFGVWVFPGDVVGIASRIGSRLEPDNDVWTNRFWIDSTSSDRKYLVAQRKSDGVWGCSCPGWRHRRWCKHITELHNKLRTIGYDVTTNMVKAGGTPED
jgi:hypothetical protein